jgi:predicted nucleic acid-binding Zn ribbon protein
MKLSEATSHTFVCSISMASDISLKSDECSHILYADLCVRNVQFLLRLRVSAYEKELCSQSSISISAAEGIAIILLVLNSISASVT